MRVGSKRCTLRERAEYQRESDLHSPGRWLYTAEVDAGFCFLYHPWSCCAICTLKHIHTATERDSSDNDNHLQQGPNRAKIDRRGEAKYQMRGRKCDVYLVYPKVAMTSCKYIFLVGK